MAGYYLDSLAWEPVREFLANPCDKHLLTFAKLISDQLDRIDSQIEDDAIMAAWPSEPEELVPILNSHLQNENWYDDFCDPEKAAWEMSISDLFSNTKVFKARFLIDPVYWSLKEEVCKHHQEAGLSYEEFSHFGSRPFRYTVSAKTDMWAWQPCHSMHTPTEVAAMAEQLAAAEETCMKSRHEEVPEEFERLTEGFQKLLKSGSVLFVSVDT